MSEAELKALASDYQAATEVFLAAYAKLDPADLDPFRKRSKQS